MILLTARLIKLALVLSIIAWAIWLSHRKWSKKQVAGFAVSTVAFAFFVNFIVGALPPLTDQVTLTALGQKCEEAVCEEIFLDGYTVDGRSYYSGKDLQIEEGKWFWVGETYVWRIETDTRQPDGITRSVTMRIPVGWSRTLDFAGGPFRGIVEISTGEETWSADTFSEDGSTVAVPIGRSTTSALILNQVCHLALFAGFLLLWFFVAVSMVQFSVHQPERYQSWMENNKGKLIYTFIALAAFCWMIYFADDASLGMDEVQQIVWASDLRACIEMLLSMTEDVNLPFYSMLVHFWYPIAPYGEQWLLLLSIVPTALSIYIIGLAGEMLRGRDCGILAALMMGFSTTVWGYAGFELRSYSYMLLFSTLTFYCHIQKSQNGEKKKWLIRYSLSLLGLAMSHYYGMLLFGVFFIVDLYLFFRKKVTWKSGFCFIPAGAAALTWLGLVYFKTLRYRGTEDIASFYPVPTMQHVVNLLRFLSGNYPFSFYVMVLGIASALTLLFDKDVRQNGKDGYYQCMPLGVITLTIGIMFFYGNVINSKSTLWFERYFTVLIPYVTILSASMIVNLLPAESGSKELWISAERVRKWVCVWVGIILIFNCTSVGISSKHEQYIYRQTADWLYTQGDTIFNPETIIIGTSNSTWGWQEYYVSRKGRRDPLNVTTQDRVTTEEVLAYNRIYIQYTWIDVGEPLSSLLDQYYILAEDHPEVQMRVYIRK